MYTTAAYVAAHVEWIDGVQRLARIDLNHGGGPGLLSVAAHPVTLGAVLCGFLNHGGGKNDKDCEGSRCHHPLPLSLPAGAVSAAPSSGQVPGYSATVCLGQKINNTVPKKALDLTHPSRCPVGSGFSAGRHSVKNGYADLGKIFKESVIRELFNGKYGRDNDGKLSFITNNGPPPKDESKEPTSDGVQNDSPRLFLLIT